MFTAMVGVMAAAILLNDNYLHRSAGVEQYRFHKFSK